MSASRRKSWIAAVLALAGLALVLRWFPDDSPIAGHVFRRHDEERYADLARSFLNGRFTVDWFINPTLYAYVAAAAAALLGGIRVLLGLDESFATFVAAETIEPWSVVVAGRAASIVASALSVMVVARIGRRLFDERAGLIAAAALATDGVAIERAPLLGNESLTVLLGLLAVDALVTAREARTRRAIACCGALLGLATAAKYSAGILVVPLLLALRGRSLPALASAAAGFLAGSWSILLAPRAFWTGFTTQAGFLEGYRASDELRGELGWRTYLLDFPEFHHGLPFALACGAALLASLIALLRRGEGARDHLLLLASVLPLYLFLGSGRFVSPRFLLPAVPFLFVLSGWGLARLGDWIASAAAAAAPRLARAASVALPLAAAGALVLPAAPASAARMRRTHGSAQVLGPLYRVAAASIGPGDRVVELAHPARDRLFWDADPWPRLGLTRPPPAELARVERSLKERGGPLRADDLVDLLAHCATLAELQAKLARLRCTRLVLHVPPALAFEPEKIRAASANPVLRRCGYWRELYEWLATLPFDGPTLSSDGSTTLAVIRLPPA